MSRRRVLFAAVLLVASLGAPLAQVPTRLVGQDRMMFRHRLEGPLQFDSLVLTFGLEPATAVTAEFRLTYGRLTEPRTGTIELVIAQKPASDNTTSRPLARKALTFDEFASLGTSDVIDVAELNLELALVESQREALVRQTGKWTGP